EPKNPEAAIMSRPSTPVSEPTSRPSAAPAPVPGQRGSRESAPLIEPPESTTKSVVERLVEQMVFPTPLPGLELRVIRRDDPRAPMKAEPSAGRESSSADDRGSAKAPSAPPSKPPAPAAPVIDVNAIAERVYRKLVRDQQRARERKG